jgi:hypothetical protein
MAKINLNPIMGRIRGKIGDLVFRQNLGDQVVGRMPNREGFVASPAQQEVVKRFRLAAAYAKAVFSNPQQKEAYVLAGKARQQVAFALAMADYLKPPTVEVLDVSAYRGQIGDVVMVEATDDFAVVGVSVAVKNDAGDVVEQGPAQLVNGRWQYIATTAIGPGEALTIEATAVDRPAHTGKKSVLVVLP